MLLVCSGQDSFRSLEKARALETAYRDKYDQAGHTVERLMNDKPGFEQLLSMTCGASLFSSRRFIRMDGLISACPKPKRDALVKALSHDADSTIVVTVEEDDLSKTDLKSYLVIPKIIQYEFPLLSPPDFSKWANEIAQKNGLIDPSCIQKLVQYSQGNSWVFMTELRKAQAGGSVQGVHEETLNSFEVIDAFLSKDLRRWQLMETLDDAQSIVSQSLNQARSFVLAQGNHTEGIHPFVAKKLQRLRSQSTERYAALATSFVWTRSGTASADESLQSLS